MLNRLVANPQFSIREWARTQPFSNQEDFKHFIEGYRLAGLPD
jgi:hypothetical protein